MIEGKTTRPVGRPRRLDPSTEQRVCEEYSNGRTLRWLGQRYGFSIQGVSMILRRNKTKTRGRREYGWIPNLSDRRVRSIVWGYGLGYSCEELAQREGVSTSTLYNLLKLKEVRFDRKRRRRKIMTGILTPSKKGAKR